MIPRQAPPRPKAEEVLALADTLLTYREPLERAGINGVANGVADAEVYLRQFAASLVPQTPEGNELRNDRELPESSGQGAGHHTDNNRATRSLPGRERGEEGSLHASNPSVSVVAQTPEGWRELERLCQSARDDTARMFGDSHYDRQTWAAIKDHLDYITDTAVPELLRSLTALTAENERLNGENDRMDGQLTELHAEVHRLTAQWEGSVECALEKRLTQVTTQRDATEALCLELTGVLNEANAVCACGCPNETHENYGEDGEACEHDHQCIRTSKAVQSMLMAQRSEIATLKGRWEQLKFRAERGGLVATLAEMKRLEEASK